MRAKLQSSLRRSATPLVRAVFVWITVLALISLMGPAAAQAPVTYVILGSGSSLPANLAAMVSASGGKLETTVDAIGVAIATSSEPEFATAMASWQGIEGTAADVQSRLFQPGTLESAPTASGNGGTSLADAALFSLQWNMKAIQADQAWAAGFQGSNVTVAVLDSGIDYTHPDLQGQVDLSRSVSFVRESVPRGLDPSIDLHTHGTHIAGIIAAKGIGVAGVAPRSTLISVKVLDKTGTGSVAGVLQGIVYATNAGADIINMSLGFTFTVNDAGSAHLLKALNRAINYAQSKGVLTVASIGNDALDLDRNRNEVKAPAQITTVVAVSATGPVYGQDPDTFASYSDFGSSTVFVAAPGGNIVRDAAGTILNPKTDRILSTCSTVSQDPIIRPLCRKGSGYLFGSGTSQAAAHVSGLAALVDGKFGGTLDAAKLRAVIHQSADDRGAPGQDQFYGFGRINAYLAVTLK